MEVKKTQNTVMLSKDTKQLIENYKSVTGTSFSVATEELILKGLENLTTAQSILTQQKEANKKLNDSIKKIENRFESTLFTILRTVAATNAKTNLISMGTKLNKEQIKTVEEAGIKKVFESLKNKVGGKAYEFI
jgi:hypothetical protein